MQPHLATKFISVDIILHGKEIKKTQYLFNEGKHPFKI